MSGAREESTCKLTSKFKVLCRLTIRSFHSYITANRQIWQRQRNGGDDRLVQSHSMLKGRERLVRDSERRAKRKFTPTQTWAYCASKFNVL